MDLMLFVLMLSGLLAVASAALAGYALHHSLESRIGVEAMKRSTHQIQFVPAEPGDEDDEKAINAEMRRQERKENGRMLSVEDLEDDAQPYN